MIARSVALFIIAGLMEIGGGYLMWLWLRDKWAWWVGALGAFILMAYGIVPTLQPAHFGRVYAAYGGVFVVMSMLGGVVDRRTTSRSLGHYRRFTLHFRGDHYHVRSARRSNTSMIQFKHLRTEI